MCACVGPSSRFILLTWPGDVSGQQHLQNRSRRHLSRLHARLKKLQAETEQLREQLKKVDE
jgi:cell division protein FtsB